MEHSRSYYRGKMKEYEKAENKLNSYEQNLKNHLNSCLDEFKGFKDVYKAEDTLRGEVMDNFDYKSEELYKKIDTLFEKIQYDIRTVANEATLAHDLYEEFRHLYESCSE